MSQENLETVTRAMKAALAKPEPDFATAAEQRVWNVVTVAGGKIVRTEAYIDPATALEALGLSE
jgi:ketosteroid isomerase-like protein